MCGLEVHGWATGLHFKTPRLDPLLHLQTRGSKPCFLTYKTGKAFSCSLEWRVQILVPTLFLVPGIYSGLPAELFRLIFIPQSCVFEAILHPFCCFFPQHEHVLLCLGTLELGSLSCGLDAADSHWRARHNYPFSTTVLRIVADVNVAVLLASLLVF